MISSNLCWPRAGSRHGDGVQAAHWRSRPHAPWPAAFMFAFFRMSVTLPDGLIWAVAGRHQGPPAEIRSGRDVPSDLADTSHQIRLHINAPTR